MTIKGKGRARFVGGGQEPEGTHMLLYTGVGEATAIPPGAMMGIRTPPQQGYPQHKMLLTNVSEKHIIFRCVCNATCTVEWHYRMTEKGQHAR